MLGDIFGGLAHDFDPKTKHDANFVLNNRLIHLPLSN
jgi:hypothetical protein